METTVSKSQGSAPPEVEQTPTTQSLSTTSARHLRPVTQTMRIHETSEGLGSHVRRCIGNSKVRCLPPFITCDFFRINDVGRPPHPSRGSQKVTVVLDGTLSMEYSPSDVIELEAGNVTSLMVGRGVLRSIRAVTPSEKSIPKPPTPPITSSYATRAMPRTECTGLNLFMDVPEPFKRIDSSHIDMCHSDLRAFSPREGIYVRIITGSAFGHLASQMLTPTPATVLDLTVEPDASIEIPVRSDWNAFVFVVEGKAIIQGEKQHKFDYVEFKRASKRRTKQRSSDTKENKADNDVGENSNKNNAKDSNMKYIDKEGESTYGFSRGQGQSQSDSVVAISVDAKAQEKSRIFFCAAEPLCQPIYRQGPFVDVSMDGIYQAFDDYTEQKNGFETRRAWQNGSQLDGAASNAHGCSEESEAEPYNPCDEGQPSDMSSTCEDKHSSDEDEVGMNCKATYPNAFPPGKVNSAEQSTEFNGNESVERQQESKVPKRPRSDSNASESSEGPEPKREKEM